MPSNQPSQGAANVPPQRGPPPTAPGPMPRFAPPPFSQVPRAQPSNTTSATDTRGSFRSYLGNQPAPPGYSHAPPAPPTAPIISDSRDRSDSLDADDQTALLG